MQCKITLNIHIACKHEETSIVTEEGNYINICLHVVYYVVIKFRITSAIINAISFSVR